MTRFGQLELRRALLSLFLLFAKLFLRQRFKLRLRLEGVVELLVDEVSKGVFEVFLPFQSFDFCQIYDLRIEMDGL